MTVFVIVLLSTVFAVAPSPQAAVKKDQKPPFRLLGPAASQLGTGAVRFPLVPSRKLESALPARVVGVSLAGVRDPGLIGAFDVKLERSIEGLWNLRVEPNPVTEKPGSYAV